MKISNKKTDEIFNRLFRVGAAIGVINGNNTHSGNLSIRDPDDPDKFYITASGSQCGALIPRDIVPLKFSDVSWGDARASTESTIHRKVLSLKGANSVVHAHFYNTTIISFDTKEKQLFLQFLGEDEKGREEFIFHPVDLYGSCCMGGVLVGSYLQPVGSAEMEERIPKYLAKDRLTIVRGHGSFVRAGSPEEALHLMGVLETSAGVVLHLKRRGVNVNDLQKSMQAEIEKKSSSNRAHYFKEIDFSRHDVTDETVLEDFRQRLIYNFNNSLGSFGTGSMSQKISADEMIYCPMSAAPVGYDFPLYRLPLNPEADDHIDLRMHKLIYAYTHQNACMITVSPLAVAESMAVLAEQWGESVLFGDPSSVSYTAKHHPVIKPIDAEAIYLNPRLGLTDQTQLNDQTANNPILNMLRWYKGCCVVAGYGVISTGGTTLEQAAHNAASAERIARFRAEVFINQKILDGPEVEGFEP